MIFKSLMTREELFKNLSSDEGKKAKIISYGIWLAKKLGRSLIADDFIVKGRISKEIIYKYFNNIYSTSSYLLPTLLATACHRLPSGDKPKKHDLNPDHLYNGTPSDNARDMLSYHPNTKLTFEIAENIRKDAKNYPFKKFGSQIKFDSKWADKLGVHPTTISAVRKNKAWRIKNEKI